MWWARQDSNLGPMDYESTALTAELRALFGFIGILQQLRFTSLDGVDWKSGGDARLFVVWFFWGSSLGD